MDGEHAETKTRRSLGLSRLLLLYGALIAFLMLTNPASLPSVVIILPFVGLFGAIYFSVIECFRLVSRAYGDTIIVRHRLGRPKVTAALVAGLPVLLLVLQSIGQLTVWDVLTAAAIFLITYFYVSKSSLAANNR